MPKEKTLREFTTKNNPFGNTNFLTPTVLGVYYNYETDRWAQISRGLDMSDKPMFGVSKLVGTKKVMGKLFSSLVQAQAHSLLFLKGQIEPELIT